MMETYYAFIPSALETVFTQAVEEWENVNQGCLAAISPVHNIPSSAPNSTTHQVGERVFPDTIQILDGTWRAFSGYCLVFDEGQLPSEAQASILSLGGLIFENNTDLLSYIGGGQNQT